MKIMTSTLEGLTSTQVTLSDLGVESLLSFAIAHLQSIQQISSKMYINI